MSRKLLIGLTGAGVVLLTGLLMLLNPSDKPTDDVVDEPDVEFVVTVDDETDDVELDSDGDDDDEASTTQSSSTSDSDFNSYLYTERPTSKNVNETVRQMEATGKIDTTMGSGKIMMHLAPGELVKESVDEDRVMSILRSGKVKADTTPAGEVAYSQFPVTAFELKEGDAAEYGAKLMFEEGSTWTVDGRDGEQIVLRIAYGGSSVYFIGYIEHDELVIVRHERY